MADGPKARQGDDGPGGTESPARMLLPALALVILGAAAATGAGLLVPASSIGDTGRLLVRVLGIALALGGLLLLVGPWRSPARVGSDAVLVVLLVACAVVGLLALLSIPASPVSFESRNDEARDGEGYRPGDGGGTGGSGRGGGSGRVVDVSVSDLDVDYDGTITASELDIDGDGRVTLDDLEILVPGVDVGYDAGDTSVDLGGLDRDGDGTISLTEAEAGSRTIDLDDLDGDGTVTADELYPDQGQAGNDEDESTPSSPDRDDESESAENENDQRDREADEASEGGDDGDNGDGGDDRGSGLNLGRLLGWMLVSLLVPIAVALIARAFGIGFRRPRGQPTGPGLAPDEPSVDADVAHSGLAASLATVAAGDDPRAAIVNAYLQLLEALAAAGAPRRAEEAPHEHLHRVLGPLGVRPGPTHRLAELFVLARFGPHAITEQHRDEATAALQAAIDDLQAHGHTTSEEMMEPSRAT